MESTVDIATYLSSKTTHPTERGVCHCDIVERTLSVQRRPNGNLLLTARQGDQYLFFELDEPSRLHLATLLS